MNRRNNALLRTLCLVAQFSVFTLMAYAGPSPATSRVVDMVDESRLTTLAGNTHPLARAAFDRGPVPSATPMGRMLLVLRRSPEQEAALRQLIDQQQDKTSPAYHQWMTPQSFGAAFGPSERDLSAVTAWLESHGFTGVRVNAGRTLIEFSGTAGDVESAFHTAIHNYSLDGTVYTANASDPKIPAALSPVVAGVASLNNFAAAGSNHAVAASQPRQPDPCGDAAWCRGAGRSGSEPAACPAAGWADRTGVHQRIG